MRLTFLAGWALCLATSALSAQAIKGKVVSDSAAVPLQGVLITLLNAKNDTVETPVRTDANGEFVLRTKDPGRYRIRATRLAFQPVTTDAFDMLIRTIYDVRLTMSAQTVLLSPMVVVGSRVISGADMMSTEGFEFRRRRQAGSYADTASIRRAGYPPMTAALKEFVPGLQTITGVMGSEEIRMTVQGAECIPDLYKDGVTQQSLMVPHINLMNSRDFYGVEVYRRPNIPLEFRRSGFECAVIAIWTKWISKPPPGAPGGR
jgi:hypothetical protein